MKTLYLHIGAPKTGTTALQWFFNRNRERLRERGVVYPALGLVGDCHHRIGASIYPYEQRPYYIRYDDTLGLDEYAGQILSIEGDVLISSELLSRGFVATLLRAVFGDIDIRIVLYLRRQDSWLVARYIDDVKTLYAGTLEEYMLLKQGILDYWSWCLAEWVEQWGAERIVVRPYDQAQLVNGSLIDDFAQHVFGWDDLANFQLPPPGLNPRLTPAAIKYKCAVNCLSVPDRVKCDLGPVLVAYSAERDASVGVPFLESSMLSPELQMQLVEDYRESNAHIARALLGRQDGRLFTPVKSGKYAHPRSVESALSADQAAELNGFVAATEPHLYSVLRRACAEAVASGEPPERAAAVLLRIE